MYVYHIQNVHKVQLYTHQMLKEGKWPRGFGEDGITKANTEITGNDETY